MHEMKLLIFDVAVYEFQDSTNEYKDLKYDPEVL
jgi:hypothetical protein